jgi:hypothetical protein
MALPREQLRSSEGLLDLGMGRLDQAVDVLAASAGRIAEMALFDRDAMPEPDLVEALVRLGRPAEARAALDAWNERGVPREVAIGGPLAARCEGLLTGDDAFSALFSRAIEGHAALEDTFGEARTRLCFGSGCGAPGFASKRETSSVRRWRHSSASEPRPGRNAPASSCARPGSGSGGRRRRGTN